VLLGVTRRSGTAQLLPNADAKARLRELPQMNSFGVRSFGTNLLTVRIDLDDHPAARIADAAGITHRLLENVPRKRGRPV